MMRYFITILFGGMMLSANSQNTPLARYVQLGLESNLALQQNMLSHKSAQQSLKIAKGMFLPKASLDSRITMARGGRFIDFPIGDLLNPVYTTLNQMLAGQGQPGDFPQVDNKQIAFMRQFEFETSVSIVQPLYNRSLYLNKKISEEQLSMNAEEIERYKGELTLKIKEAYFNYLKTIQIEGLVERMKELVNENHRIAKKLFDNGITSNDVVMRANSEISKVLLMENEIRKNKTMAKSYFNFLLNRGFETEIEISQTPPSNNSSDLNALTQIAVANRNELKQLESQTIIYNLVAGLSTSEMLPNVALAFQYGLQGETINSFEENDFLLGSVVMNWSLFNGNINKNKRQQALIEKEKSIIKKQEVANQIRLEVQQNYLEVQQQNQNLELAKNREIEAKEVYRMVEKRYRQGETSLIELLDARNNMVEAESNVINNQYELLVGVARLEKSAGIK